MSWTFQPALTAIGGVRKDWEALNRSRHILLDPGFVEPLVRHFGNADLVLGAGHNGTKSWLTLLTRKGTGLWETFQPSQSPLGLIVTSDPDASGEQLLEATKRLPGYALQLSIMQQDPDYTSFPPVSGRAEFQYMDYIRTARLPLEGTFEAYWSSRGSNLRHNLARRGRRMKENGLSAELIAFEKPEEVAEAIREYGRLESLGWKGKNGTAVSENNAQGRFYRDVFEHFCSLGEATIYQYRLNGKVAASDLCLRRDSMMIVLKTAYDEELDEFSPALQMRRDITEQLFAGQQVRVVEFYGRVMDWHTRWTDQVRTMYHVNCFRHPWVENVKKVVKKFRGSHSE